MAELSENSVLISPVSTMGRKKYSLRCKIFFSLIQVYKYRDDRQMFIIYIYTHRFNNVFYEYTFLILLQPRLFFHYSQNFGFRIRIQAPVISYMPFLTKHVDVFALYFPFKNKVNYMIFLSCRLVVDGMYIKWYPQWSADRKHQ